MNGCFHILIIVSNTAVNIELHISFQTSGFFSLTKYPKVEKLYYIIFQFSIFLGTSVLFSIVTGSVYILPTVHKTSFFSISFSSFYLLSFLIIAILKAMKCYLIVVFICIYLTFKDVEHLMCLLAM